MRAKLDELLAGVRAAQGRQARSQPLDEAAWPTETTDTYGALAALGRVWIEWLVEAAGAGDPAARAHLRSLGFHDFGQPESPVP